MGSCHLEDVRNEYKEDEWIFTELQRESAMINDAVYRKRSDGQGNGSVCSSSILL
ncbi:hypothetical protein KIN20_020060 [Parelaphostrongylus tenuis]|uniref:Uncharacterized protein n=1 Tax=Parelaphostrongylus tenuis TaxID=148309 RepID=A0AAD5N626_PARTN|nr:hypothetical protein KIN20_020057 [Parelaphostrongylus tenuis]KAJ1360934.1 hypothetical protein KIN20_020060 [Parelaphostrongylus tenuis]